MESKKGVLDDIKLNPFTPYEVFLGRLAYENACPLGNRLQGGGEEEEEQNEKKSTKNWELPEAYVGEDLKLEDYLLQEGDANVYTERLDKMTTKEWQEGQTLKIEWNESILRELKNSFWSLITPTPP